MHLEGRHSATVAIAKWFANAHLQGEPFIVSGWCRDLAEVMIRTLPDGPELTVGLRKLLEAKDCFVRAALDAGRAEA